MFSPTYWIWARISPLPTHTPCVLRANWPATKSIFAGAADGTWVYLAGGNRSTGDRLVRCCMFTDALLAHVGLSESEPQREGITARVAKLPMSAILRTEATDEKQASRSS